MSKLDTPYHRLPDYSVLIDRLYQIRAAVNSEHEDLGKTIRECRSDDARLTAIGHIGQLLDSTILILTFIHRHLLPLDGPWWDEVYKAPFAPFDTRNKSILINNLTVGFAKVAFIQNLFSIIDSSVRIFLRAIEPTKEPPMKFSDAFKRLKGKLAPLPPDSDDLLTLLARTRNIVHNNGVYFFPNKADETLEFKGRSYEFKYGQPIKYVTWEWLIERVPEVLLVLNHVVRDPRILEIEYIHDPFVLRPQEANRSEEGVID
ncbi:MAG: hypothetical protein QOD75_812 [Blastocatellia bacterium]|jgi:hypothetical protein|nr:hypothetical protein [Blastocatellia bacterium]